MTQVNDGQARYDELVEVGALHIRSERDGDSYTIALRGEFDLANASAVEDQLKSAEATDARSIVLDLSGLTFMDSTGIRLILEAQARSQADNERLVLRRAPASVQRVFGIAGVEEMLPFAE
jgi:anti-anti-sigma factor